MSSFVGFSQSASADMRINLRGRKALVSKQFLDTSQIRPTVEQMGRKAVPQCVG